MLDKVVIGVDGHGSILNFRCRSFPPLLALFSAKLLLAIGLTCKDETADEPETTMEALLPAIMAPLPEEEVSGPAKASMAEELTVAPEAVMPLICDADR